MGKTFEWTIILSEFSFGNFELFLDIILAFFALKNPKLIFHIFFPSLNNNMIMCVMLISVASAGMIFALVVILLNNNSFQSLDNIFICGIGLNIFHRQSLSYFLFGVFEDRHLTLKYINLNKLKIKKSLLGLDSFSY